MARVPELIRRNPVSQVAATPPPAGQGWAAVAQLAKIGEDFVRPAAHEQARETGENAVYRDESGSLAVNERSVLGGELAEVQNSAAYAKYMGQMNIDMSENFTEMAQSYEFDPAGFKAASDGYIEMLQEDMNIPAVLKESLINSAQQEGLRRFNGLRGSEIDRNYADANRNTKTARNMMVDDYVALMQAGDTEAADEKMAEIQATTDYRVSAPYIRETDVEGGAFLEGVVGAGRAAQLSRELNEMEHDTSITDERRQEITDTLNDPAISAADRNRLYIATQGVLKGIDANAIVANLTDTSFMGAINRQNRMASPRLNLMDFAVSGATRTDSFSGMHDDFRVALEDMFAAAPESIRASLNVSSGFRSNERQAQLWAEALEKYGSAAEARKWVAPPGSSQHNHGNAADLRFASDEARAWMHENAAEFGLSFPLSNENWHIELATARGGPARPVGEVQDPQIRQSSNAAGLEAVGIPTTDQNQMMAWTFGIEDAVRMIDGDPAALVSEIMAPEFIEQNPVFSTMNVAQAKEWADRQVTTKASDLASQQVEIDRIDDPEVRALAASQLSDQVRVQQRAEASAALPYGDRLAANDDTLTEQEILADHTISDSMQSSLVSKLRSLRKDAIEIQQTVMNLNDPNFSWDPYDSTQRNAVDDAFKASIEGGDPLGDPMAAASAAQIAERTGFVPKTMFNAIRSASLSGDPARVAVAMEFASQVLDVQPNAFGPYGGRVDVMNVLSDYKFYAEFNNGEEAAAVVVDNMQADPPKNVTDAAKDAAKNLDISDVADHFDNTGMFSSPNLGNDIEQETMMSEYRRIFQDEFLSTGDNALSRNRALDQIGRIYAPNTVTGSNRIMKFPPQNFYPSINGNQDWMQDQLEADLNQIVFGDEAQSPQGGLAFLGEGFLAAAGDMNWISAENVKLVSDETTRAQVMRGEPPSYVAYYMRDGLVNAIPQRFNFDPSGYQTPDAAVEAERAHGIATNTQRYESLINQHGTEEGTRLYLEDVDAIR